MADSQECKSDRPAEDGFVIDSAYLRAQAGEALRTFAAPFSGVVRAATGADERRRSARTRRKKATIST